MAGIQINVSDMALTNEGQAICTQGPESPPGIDMFRVYTAGERWEIFRYQLGHILSSGCRYTGLVETAEFGGAHKNLQLGESWTFQSGAILLESPR